MGRLQTKVAECKYRKYDRLLTEQLIGGLSVKSMADKILRKVSMSQDFEKATSGHVLT